MTDTTLPDVPLDTAADRLEALGSPVRLRIVRELVRVGENGLPVSGLQERVGVAPSTLSHHLRKLVAVDLVVQERQGTTLLCRAQYDTIRSLADFLLSECCIEDDAATGGC